MNARRHRARAWLFAPGIALGLAGGASGGFVDVATQAGLVIDPPAAVETNPPQGIDPYTSGAPVCAADLDRDGWTDLLLSPTPGRLRVFMNQRDGTFREEGVARGFGDMSDIGGIAAGDLSNSGRTDVFLVPRSGDRYFLFANDGTGHFTEVAAARGADLVAPGETHKGQSVALVDFDRDGFLDIHVTEWGVTSTTDATRYAVLLRNRGHERPGHFLNVTAAAGLTQPHYGPSMRTFASAWADFDGDGWPDLSLISDYGTSQLWWNNGDGTFSEDRAGAGVGTDSNGMGVAVADFDRDGRLDFFVSSFDVGSGGVLASANRLYRNRGDRRFEDVAAAWGVLDSGWGWGAVAFDPDNDGRQDLLVTNGYNYVAADGQAAPPHHIADARNDRTRFFHNAGIAMFESGPAWGVTDTRIGHGVCVLDHDNDGDEDVVIGNLYGPWILYRNDTPAPANRWLRLRLTGTTSCRDGYGAVVRATAGGVTQTAVHAPTNAYLGQREPVLHLGLGASATVDTLVVTWPSGTVQTLDGVATNQVLEVVEPASTVVQPPELTLTPVGGTFEKDAEVVLRVEATGSPAPSYAWYRNGVAVPGATRAELVLRDLHPSDAGTYTVVVTNAAGSVTSAPATVQVTADIARHSVARWWNEALLDGIRRDTPNPPVHARNLYHLSAAMWDAYWACADEGWSAAAPVLHRETPSAAGLGTDRAAAQREAISYAAHRVITQRFANSPGTASTLLGARWLMEQLGYDPDFTGTTGDSPAAVGNRIGYGVLAAALDDGANEAGRYADMTGYDAVNDPLVVELPGTTMVDPNRWQPLSLRYSITQNGIVLPTGLQPFVGVNAPLTTTFALARPAPMTIALDPGPPPQLGGAGHDRVVQDVVDVIWFSSMLDPSDPTEVDISPGAMMNNPLGTNDGTGRALNPVTGQPYAPNRVRRADYSRVLAEYWADGPHSETPPGHWNVIFNQVSDAPGANHRYGGTGAVLPRLEWDVRGYLALNGALHDAACAAWTLKRRYDGVRPISLVRHMGGLGQSSDPAGPRYHPLGLPLVPGLIELTTIESVSPGGRHASIAQTRGSLDSFVGRIVIWAWLGNPADPRSQVGGVGWVLAERWVPYQPDTFVTPAFPGYVSGHSTFSRTAAEVLTLLTGSPFFPGGLSSATFAQDGYLTFERGPSRDVVLQWATFHDAADQAGLSRLFGGIHVPVDDVTGRRLGARIGLDGFLRAHALRSTGRAPAGLANVSTRGVCGEGERALIAGFVVGPGEREDVLVRAIGPGLEPFGLPREICAPDPVLAVHRSGGAGELVLVNDQWELSPRRADILSLGQARGAFPLTAGSPDAAEILDVTGGGFTVVAQSGANDRLPVQLVEAYGDRLVNVSTRGFVGRGDAVLVAGFSLTGHGPAVLLIRGIGPSLGPLGIHAPLADPVLRVHRVQPGGVSEVVAENDNWSDDPRASLALVGAEAVGAFAIAPGTSDAALLVQLMPGLYTATLSGRGDGEGIGLVEVYHVW